MLLPGIGFLVNSRAWDGLKILFALNNSNNIPPCEVCAFLFLYPDQKENPTPERRIAANLKNSTCEPNPTRFLIPVDSGNSGLSPLMATFLVMALQIALFLVLPPTKPL